MNRPKMKGPSSHTHTVAGPIAAASLGVASFTIMDALMKDAGMAIGAYNALLWRGMISTLITGCVFFALRLPWPSASVLRIHLQRGVVVAGMALAWFWAIIRLPLAEAIAISFIAPLIALYLAAILLDEDIRPGAIIGSIMGLAGVVIIIAFRVDAAQPETLHSQSEIIWGIVAVLVSAVLFAYNLILARKQALVAKPVEITFFQNMLVTSVFALGAPWFAVIPDIAAVWPMLGGASLLSMLSLLLLSWAYARAEAQILIPIEYTAFVWAALFGWLMFDENVTRATVAGTAMIIAGCILATRAAKRDPKGAVSE